MPTDPSISTRPSETTALHLQSSHWLTDLLIGLGDGILLPSMWLLASWQSGWPVTTKIEIAVALVLIQSALHGISLYATSLKRDQSNFTPLTDTNKRSKQPVASSDVKAFLAELDIPAPIQEQAWQETETEKERWNAQLKDLQIGHEKPVKSRALQSALLVMLGYLLGGAGPIWLGMKQDLITAPLFMGVILLLKGGSTWIKARYTQTSVVSGVSRQVGAAALILLFAWLLGRFLITQLFAGG